MANIRKSFNFRNGVQVDDDNFIINPNGLVGIGTTIPTEILDVRGTAKIVGLVTASQIYTPTLTAVNASFTNLTLGNSIVGGGVSIKSGIITASGSGIVTYYGDGGNLINLPTSQWLDIDVGLGFTSIYARGFVGIGTNDPRFLLQLGGNNNTTLGGFANGVGINSSGSILATGIVTAYKFSGIGSDLTLINADNISSGTIGTDRIPKLRTNQMPDSINASGIITASGGLVSGSATITGNVSISGNVNVTGVGTFNGGVVGNLTGNVNSSGVSTFSGGVVGNLTGNVNSSGVSTFSGGIIGNVVGIASTARDLTSNARINIQDIQASTSTIGISTVSTRLRVSGTIGVSTNSPQADIHIVNASDASLHLTGNQSTITLGRSSSPTGGNSSGLKFGNTSGLYSYSTQKTLDVFNYDTGNLNSYLHYGSTAGVGTGSFNWIYGQSPSTPLMSLTYQGNLGIGITNPTKELEVDGSIQTNSLNVTGDFTAIGSGTSTSVRKLYIYDGATALLDSAGNQLISNDGINQTSGIATFYDLNVTNNATIANNISIGHTLPPLDRLHIAGDYLTNPGDSLVMNQTGIGIGTTSIRFNLGIDAEESDVIFSTVGVGTTNVDGSPNIDDPINGTRFYVAGNSVIIGSSIIYNNLGIGTTNPTSKLTVNGNTNISGITTTNSLNIGATQVISSGRQLQNISSLDATTTSTIESAITNAPNTFTNLEITGISTFAGITTVTGATLFAKQLNVSGVITASQFIKSSGTSSQFLKADGSVDSSTYLTSYTETDTLNTVTNRGNSTSNGVSVGILTATTLKIGTGVTVGAGIVTATDGFTSGIGTAVKITTVGNILTFTVPGVGTTSLILY